LIYSAYQADKVTASAQTYNEKLHIHTGIHFLGAGSGSTTIDGGIKIAAYEVMDLLIEGMTLKGTYVAGNDQAVITVSATTNLINFELKDCVLDGENESGRYAFHGSSLVRGTLKITGTKFEKFLG